MVELKQHTHYLLIQSINNMSNTMAFHAQRTTLFFLQCSNRQLKWTK